MSKENMQLYLECTCVLVEPFPRLRVLERNLYSICSDPERMKEYNELVQKERDYYKQLAAKRFQFIQLLAYSPKVSS